MLFQTLFLKESNKKEKGSFQETNNKIINKINN